MIGGGIFNQPVMGNKVFILIQNIAKFCLTGINKTISNINGVAVESNALTGINESEVNLTVKVKQRCDLGC